jgi:hypothetical protein
MTPGEFREIAKAMQEFGIARFKSGDTEVIARKAPTTTAEASPKAAFIPNDTPAQLQNASDDPIKHKVEELTSLMKLGDIELVDRLFPDHRNEDHLDFDVPEGAA